MNITHFHIQGLFNPASGISDGVDTGGQTRFVHEVAYAQAQEGHNVTVVARLMDASVSGSSESELSRQSYGRRGEAPYTIRRVEFGDKNKFVRKEDMYSKVPQISHAVSKSLKEQLAETDLIVSHYADAGLVAEQVKNDIFDKHGRNVPHLHIPHSIGYAKMTGLFESLPNDNQAAQKKLDEIYSEKYNFNQRLGAEQYIYNHVDLLVHTSDSQVGMGHEYPYFATNTPHTVIHPGYNKQVFYPSNKPEQRVKALDELGFPGIKEEDTVIGIAARFVPEKGYGSLIKAMPFIVAENPNVKFLMIGGDYKDPHDAKLLKELQEESKQVLGSAEKAEELIFWREGMDQQDLAGEFRNIDVFTSLRRNEPFGMAALEATASGASVVVDGTSGIAETLPEDVISRCDASNPRELADMILNANKFDKSRAIEHVNSNYTWGAIGQKIVEEAKNTSVRPARSVPSINRLSSNSDDIFACHKLASGVKCLKYENN